MDVDLKLASRVRGIDAILGGHTRRRAGAGGGRQTLVTNAGSNGKFLGVLDLKVSGSGVEDYRYRLLPVFSNLLSPDADMAAYIEERCLMSLARNTRYDRRLLYRRQLQRHLGRAHHAGDARRERRGDRLSPGFRWGTTLLPGDAITFEHVMDQTAITYPYSTLNELTGEQIKAILEDVADNLLNPDPYLQGATWSASRA